jgi:hypothetical protein
VLQSDLESPSRRHLINEVSLPVRYLQGRKRYRIHTRKTIDQTPCFWSNYNNNAQSNLSKMIIPYCSANSILSKSPHQAPELLDLDLSAV